MKWLDRIARSVGYAPAHATRGYDAAAVNRLTQDWNASQRSIDADIRVGIVPVRQRARELTQNNDYAKRYLHLVRVNVTGPQGFKLQMNVRELKRLDTGGSQWIPDDFANTILEQAFAKWSKAATASINGRLSFRGICDQVIRYVVRDGEAIVRMYRSKKIPFGFALQVLDPSYLDERWNTRLDNGNIVKMGVELDPNRKPVAYYFRTMNSELEVYGFNSYTSERQRVPADEILHLYDQEYENQTRGISWLVQSMLRLRMLSGYEEAALINARVSAAKGGFFTSTVEGGGEFTGETDATGNVMISGEPGSMEQLPAGMDFKPWTPEYPTAQHEMFTKATIRGIAAGLSVSFESLGNNRSDASFSSIRSGAVEERDSWKLAQAWFREGFLEPLFAQWLDMALLTKAVNLPIEKYEKFNAPIWVGRRWDWVDPLKDIAAMSLAREIKLETLTQQLAERGDTLTETLQEFAAEEKEANALGLSTVVVTKATGSVSSAEGAPADEPPADGNTDGTTKKKLLDQAFEIISPKNGNGKH